MEKYMTSGLQDRKIVWLKDSKTEKIYDFKDSRTDQIWLEDSKKEKIYGLRTQRWKKYMT